MVPSSEAFEQLVTVTEGKGDLLSCAHNLDRCIYSLLHNPTILHNAHTGCFFFTGTPLKFTNFLSPKKGLFFPALNYNGVPIVPKKLVFISSGAPP